MNKKLLLIVGAVLVVAVGAYLFLNKSSSPSSQTSNNPQSPEQLSNMVMSAFEGSGSIKCTFADENSQGTAYIKNGMVRFESVGTDSAKPTNAVMKNDTVWTWETGGTEGFMMKNISQYQNDPNVPEENKVTADKVREQISQNEANCNKENISDSMFDTPADVVFADFSSMMEDAQNQIPEGFELPEGVELPEGYQAPGN